MNKRIGVLGLLALVVLVGSAGLCAIPYVFVGNESSNVVSVIDSATNTVLGNVDGTFVSPFAMALTPAGDKLYVANRPRLAQQVIQVVDTVTCAVTGEVTNPTADPLNGIRSIAITPNGLKAYVANYAGPSSFVSVVDVANDEVTGLVADPDGTFSGPISIAITPDGQSAYVANSGGNSVSVIDIDTDTVRKVIPVAAPVDIVVAPNGEMVYVVSEFIGITVIATATDTVVDLIQDGQVVLQPNALAITPDGAMLYVANAVPTYSVSYIETATKKIGGPIPVPLEGIIKTLAVTPDGTRVYLVHYATLGFAKVNIIDTKTNQIAGSVDDALEPFDLPWSMAMPWGMQPPVNLGGIKTSDIFATQVDLINLLSWSAPVGGLAPAKYQVYREAVLPANLIGTVLGTAQPLQFADHNRVPGRSYTYFVVSVNQFGFASIPAVATVF